MNQIQRTGAIAIRPALSSTASAVSLSNPVTQKILRACGGFERFQNFPKIAFDRAYLESNYIVIKKNTLEEMSTNVATGVDPFGRIFISLKTDIHLLGSYDSLSKETITQVETLFQRYALGDQARLDTWTASSSEGFSTFQSISHSESDQIQTLEQLLKGQKTLTQYLGQKALISLSEP